ncbi:MAG: valine--tRNA ligase [Phycisphaerales bacterium JB065]
MSSTAPATTDATAELPRKYVPSEHEPRVRELWDRSGAFHADPKAVLAGEGKPYCILIPPPNVTARLHLGHALNNTLQDILVRAHRMKGYETLWMPGTDHAGIATQTVVDKRLQAEGQPALKDYKLREAAGEPGREEFTNKVQEWKDEYEQVITDQLKMMGCSCDWARQRFTMDDICARAVREAFFQLFKDGLIYRGKRLVNWDPVTQTALSDDEVEMEEVAGNFYYLHYPLVDENGAYITVDALRDRGYPAEHLPEPVSLDGTDNIACITVATTRPETYFGDTGVAINPKDPRAAALRGLKVKLPLVGRIIPIVEDDYVVMPDFITGEDSGDPKAQMATGFLKVTPAHDPNDWEIGQRHGLEIINVMAPDASISDAHGWTDIGDAKDFIGLSREDARIEVKKRFKPLGLLGEVKPYRHSVGHSYRSHAAIEPYLSDQWYCKVTDEKLRGWANDALVPEQRSAGSTSSSGTGSGSLRFYPDRYAKTYETWHDNLRDWCISRQLWWGHRIPIWTSIIPDAEGGRPEDCANGVMSEQLQRLIDEYMLFFEAAGANGEVAVRPASDEVQTWLDLCVSGESGANAVELINAAYYMAQSTSGFEALRANLKRIGNPLADSGDNTLRLASEIAAHLEAPYTQDPDVLDTWFSSALWPLSTLGWPDSEQSDDTRDLLDAFNPTSVLCTAREIITLWVSRMVMFNRYFLSPDGGQSPGQIPFSDVFIHAMIQDGEGRKMSKSLGNGVDPLDIIDSHGSDALRFTLANMATNTQDVRMPVERDETTGKNTSPKFDIGRNFVTKLFNATKFALMNIDEATTTSTDPVKAESLSATDRWMLSRLRTTVDRCESALANYTFSEYASALYDVLWRDYCDWYLEAVKPTVKTNPTQQAILVTALDAIVRLLHPVCPFVTETLHPHIQRASAKVGEVPGIELGEAEELLCTTPWPDIAADLRNDEAEAAFEYLRGLTESVRQVRAQNKIGFKTPVTLHAPAAVLDRIKAGSGLVETLSNSTPTTDAPGAGAVPFTYEAEEFFVSGFADGSGVDAESAKAQLEESKAKLAKDIAALEGRLANKGYTDKAPAHLVEETRNQLEQKKTELAAVTKRLDELG